MILSKLYVYAKKGSALKPGSLVGDCALRADYITLPNGDALGVVHAYSAKARQTMEAATGLTVLPPLHRPITSDQVTLLGVCGAALGDTTYDVGLKAFSAFSMPWLHPENGPD